MTVVRGAAAVPAAPLLLPEASPDQPAADRAPVAELRERVRAILDGLPDADVVVLVAPGARGIHDRALASLRPLGTAAADVTLPVDERLVPHVTRLTQYPLALGGSLGVEHTVLARLIHAVRGPETCVLPIAVSAATDGAVLVNVGASLVEALRDADRTAVVVAASDLSAGLTDTSPAAWVPGAEEWDRRAVAVFSARDTAGLAACGPGEAHKVWAAGWPSLTVLSGVAAGARLQVDGDVGYHVVRGVGRLTAALAPSGEPLPGGSLRQDGAGPLTLPRDGGG